MKKFNIKGGRLLRFLLFSLVLLLSSLLFISCGGGGDGGDGDDGDDDNDEKYVNVQIPAYGITVRVEYNAYFEMILDLESTLRSALNDASIEEKGSFLGLFDTSDGGNLIFSSHGVLESGYMFANGTTLYARFSSVADGSGSGSSGSTPTAREKTITLYCYPEGTKKNYVYKTITVTEGKTKTLGGPPYYHDDDLIGWIEQYDEDTDRKRATDRDGKILESYDFFERTATNFYPALSSGGAVRAYAHTNDGVVTIEIPRGSNALGSMPSDDDGESIIYGWSLDKDAGTYDDILYSKHIYDKDELYLTEGAHYYPIYSKYKEVNIVYPDAPEDSTSSIKYEITNDKAYLRYTYQQYLQGTRYYVGYLDDNGKLITDKEIEFKNIKSTTYTAIPKSRATVDLKISLVDSTLGKAAVHSYKLYNAKMFIADAVSPGYTFEGWYLDYEGKEGKVLYIRTDETGQVLVKLDSRADEVVMPSGNFALYAKYVGMDGYLGL